MTAKPVIPRAAAERDVEDALAYYLNQGARQAALGFIDALERAYGRIGANPASGSPRYAHELNLPGLRSWPLGRYPYVVFYVERDDHVDVWRVLHGQSDIPAWMSAED
jgi:toxin ParE1/3/4